MHAHPKYRKTKASSVISYFLINPGINPRIILMRLIMSFLKRRHRVSLVANPRKSFMRRIRPVILFS